MNIGINYLDMDFNIHWFTALVRKTKMRRLRHFALREKLSTHVPAERQNKLWFFLYLSSLGAKISRVILRGNNTLHCFSLYAT